MPSIKYIETLKNCVAAADPSPSQSRKTDDQFMAPETSGEGETSDFLSVTAGMFFILMALMQNSMFIDYDRNVHFIFLCLSKRWQLLHISK